MGPAPPCSGFGWVGVFYGRRSVNGPLGLEAIVPLRRNHLGALIRRWAAQIWNQCSLRVTRFDRGIQILGSTMNTDLRSFWFNLGAWRLIQRPTELHPFGCAIYTWTPLFIRIRTRRPLRISPVSVWLMRRSPCLLWIWGPVQRSFKLNKWNRKWICNRKIIARTSIIHRKCIWTPNYSIPVPKIL
jgi:hypothetical protein